MSLDYLRATYNVPAQRGARVAYTGNGKRQLGEITGAQGAHLLIRLIGEKVAQPYHPTWKLEYMDAEPVDA
ncbi:MAG: hypothetical protein WBL20_08075 [Sphingobium sp.]|uniref:hypothetical protein n=1 Tax=Sphingobium sp. TaxID=1912891 RepID=UPI003BB0148A